MVRQARVALLILLLLPCLTDLSPVWAAKTRGKPPAKPKGITHVVQPGQTLFRISQAYRVSVASLLEANRLRPSSALKVGQKLVIPGATSVKTVEPYQPLTSQEREALETSLQEERTAAPPSVEPPRPRVRTDAALIWPLPGPINSPFGPRWGKFHAGIDIGSPHYQEVVAAADGEVIYAADTRGGLGRAVVLQHDAGAQPVHVVVDEGMRVAAVQRDQHLVQRNRRGLLSRQLV